ncbi:DNA-3-methyladenine glycosylase I [Teredinibacter purpureus]|jgi:3-methyladenine DNA glycosylase|uniref:DNA-3-methyladenine glycosylase I n=1 Tax=Teredinibacter purpureus TaxID=2731756 RepID=UPI0005F7EAD4|nr:DNA-3-methyladenine glycosylase I [Teredinibacter purpureus]
MIEFDQLYQTAILHKGGEHRVAEYLPHIQTHADLCAQPNAYYLSRMSLRIFRAGLKHEMVDRKWPAFETAFRGFDPFSCAMLSDEDIEGLMTNKAIIRHLGKIKSVRRNGLFVRNLADEYGSFGQWLADWPADDIVGLWLYLKKQGAQLGGMSGPYFLRMVGKDTFLLTRDVVAVLVAQGVVDKVPTSQKDLRLVEAAFLEWQQQSKRSFAAISRIISMTTAAL